MTVLGCLIHMVPCAKVADRLVFFRIGNPQNIESKVTHFIHFRFVPLFVYEMDGLKVQIEADLW